MRKFYRGIRIYYQKTIIINDIDENIENSNKNSIFPQKRTKKSKIIDIC